MRIIYGAMRDKAIEEITNGLSGDRKTAIGKMLRKYEGWTWREALDAHAAEKRPAPSAGGPEQK